MTVRRRWCVLQRKFNALSLRERVLVMVCATALTAGGGYALLLRPAWMALENARGGTERAESNAQRMLQLLEQQQQQSQRLMLQRDAEIQSLRADLDLHGQQPVRALETNRLLSLLVELVEQQRGAVRLLSMTSMPDAEPEADAAPRSTAQAPAAAPSRQNAPTRNPLAHGVAPASSAQAPATPSGPKEHHFYRHGIEMVLSGNYGALHQYLSNLAHDEPRLRVHQMQLTVHRHPELRLTLLLETLSEDRAWLTL